MTISDALKLAAELLDHSGVAEYRREATSLLAFVLQKEAAFPIAHPEYELKENEVSTFEAVLKRRASREPFQYIVGRQEFFRLEFEVCPDVLIPRPETEILVEAAIEILSALDDPTFCEIGVGSGCIAVSILQTVENAKVVGVDISSSALSVAARNAARHRVADRLILSKADVFEGLTGAFDLIVSNPPYVPDAQLESLQAEVRQFEPHTALSGGSDGLSVIRRIVDGAPRFLNPRGILLMEIGFDQAKRVKELFDMSGWESVRFLPDLQGIPRIVKAVLRR